jgi:predicted DNA-binding protein
MNEARFEFRLPAHCRRELDELAEATGLSSAALTRLAIQRLLKHRDVLLSSEAERADQ